MSRLLTDSAENLEPLRTQPSYDFYDLQEIWNVQKEIIKEFKNTQVPFINLDHENKGFLTAHEFSDRLMSRGFPSNTSIYLKFFAFLDTDCDGIINQQDWVQGFKNIGSYLFEARAMARDHLKKVRAAIPYQPFTTALPNLVSNKITSPQSLPILKGEISSLNFIPQEESYKEAKAYTLNDFRTIEKRPIEPQFFTSHHLQPRVPSNRPLIQDIKVGNRQIIPEKPTNHVIQYEEKKSIEEKVSYLCGTQLQAKTNVSNKAESLNCIKEAKVSIDKEPCSQNNVSSNLVPEAKEKALAEDISEKLKMLIKRVDSISNQEQRIDKQLNPQGCILEKPKEHEAIPELKKIEQQNLVQSKKDSSASLEEMKELERKSDNQNSNQSLPSSALSEKSTSRIDAQSLNKVSSGKNSVDLDLKNVGKKFEGSQSAKEVDEFMSKNSQSMSQVSVNKESIDVCSKNEVSKAEEASKSIKEINEKLSNLSLSLNQVSNGKKSQDSNSNTEIQKTQEMLQDFGKETIKTPAPQVSSQASNERRSIDFGLTQAVIRKAESDLLKPSQTGSQISQGRRSMDIDSNHMVPKAVGTSQSIPQTLSQTSIEKRSIDANSNIAAQKAQEIHESIKEASRDAVDIIRFVLEPQKDKVSEKQGSVNNQVRSLERSLSKASNEKEGYVPSVTSIAGAEEKAGKSEKGTSNNQVENKGGSQKGIKSLGTLENTLEAKIQRGSLHNLDGVNHIKLEGSGMSFRNNDKVSNSQGLIEDINNAPKAKDSLSRKESISSRKQSGTGSKTSLVSKPENSSAFVVQTIESQAEDYRNLRKESIGIVVHPTEFDPNEMGTPSWKEFPTNFGHHQEQDVAEMMEQLLEQNGGLEETLSLLKREDLRKFPHLQTLIKGLEQELIEKNMIKEQEEANESIMTSEERGRLAQRRKESQTKSMVELKVRGDLSMEIEQDVKRRRGLSTDSNKSAAEQKLKERPSLANIEKMVASLKDVGNTSMRKETALEVLEEKVKERERKISADERKSARGTDGNKKEKVEFAVRSPKGRKYGEFKKMCKQLAGTFCEEGDPKESKEKLWSSSAYKISSEEVRIAKKKRLVKGIYEEDSEDEDDKNSRLKKVIDQLSQETARMEKKLSQTRLSPAKGYLSHLNEKERSQNLWEIFKQTEQDRKEEKKPITSFLRSFETSRLEGENSKLTVDQYSVQDQLGGSLKNNRVLNKYSKIAADLKSFSLRLDKVPQEPRSPLASVRSSKFINLNMNEFDKDFSGRGKTYLISQFTRLDTVNKDFTQVNKSLKKASMHSNIH